MRGVFVVFIMMFVFVPLAYAGDISSELPADDKIELARKKTHELCYDMHEGDVLSYSYTSDKSLYFNIHYHEGDEVLYLAKDDGGGADQAEGTVTIPQSTAICLMWENRAFGAPAVLEYQAALVEAEDESGAQ